MQMFLDTLNADLMKHILDDNLLASAQLHFNFNPPEQWYFQQDNDPKHRSRVVKKWLHDHGVTEMEFPPYSPDLNPIENVWSEFKRHVSERETKTIDQLQDVILDEWEKVSIDSIVKLIESMPKRVQAVIAANGDHIPY
jgi:hypothetical protein